MTVLDVNTHEDFLNFLQSDKIIVVDFHAEWCGPCKRIAPFFEELERQSDSDKFVFLRVDVDENEESASYANIQSMPTFQVYSNGKKVNELIGANAQSLRILVSDEDPWRIDH